MKIRHLLITIPLLFGVVLAQQKSITGTVKRADNSAVTGVIVVLENSGQVIQQYTTDALGNFTLSIPQGTYSQLRVRNTGSQIEKIPRQIEHTATTNLTINKDTSINITLPVYVHIHGKVLSSTGDTLKGAQITAKKWAGYEQTPWDMSTSNSQDGSYSVYQEAGGVKIWVIPPIGNGLNDYAAEFSFNKDTIFNIILPKSIIFSGSVQNYKGDTLKGIGVTLEKLTGGQIDSFTNSNGRFSIPVNGGMYKVRLRNSGANISGAPRVLEETVIQSINIQKDTNISLRLPQFPSVKFLVVNDNGSPVNKVSIYSKKWIGTEQTPWNWDTTNSSGLCTLELAADSNKLWITPPQGSDYISATNIVYTPKDTTITITLSKGIQLSGYVYKSDSAKVKGITIAIEKGADQVQATTDSTGFYNFKLQTGAYKLRVRNMNTPIVGIPQTLEYTVMDTILLSSTRTINIKLPLFPTISGTVKDPNGNPVSGTTIVAKRWLGYEQTPWAQHTTSNDGKYSLVVGSGINKVWVTPPQGSLLGAFDFTENFDSSKIRDIYIAEQAKGIKRIQPSVISQGQKGNIMINGINCNFAGSISLDLGKGITLSNIKVISPITLTADIDISDTAQSGNRDIIVKMGSSNFVGTSLLTITPPASDTLKLDNQNKTTEEVRISDGTGTELIIPKGTEVNIPKGIEPIISFVAPIIKDTSTNPTSAEFTEIQRELSPSGTTFATPVTVVSAYKDQDVVGMNETSLTPFYFTDEKGGGKASVGDTIQIIARDTSANTVSIALKHFSMFRLASIKGNTNVSKEQITKQSLQIESIVIKNKQNIAIKLRTPSDIPNTKFTFTIIDLRGVKIWSTETFIKNNGRTVQITSNVNKRIFSNGTYIFRIQIGNEIRSKTVMITH